jgi:hypothetical protein
MICLNSKSKLEYTSKEYNYYRIRFQLPEQIIESCELLYAMENVMNVWEMSKWEDMKL